MKKLLLFLIAVLLFSCGQSLFNDYFIVINIEKGFETKKFRYSLEQQYGGRIITIDTDSLYLIGDTLRFHK